MREAGSLSQVCVPSGKYCTSQSLSLLKVVLSQFPSIPSTWISPLLILTSLNGLNHRWTISMLLS